MANPQAGEVSYVFNDGKNEKHYTFKFSNRGKVETETQAEMSRQEILRSLDTGFSDKVRTALFWGATRKFHARDFPNVAMVDGFYDDFDDAIAEAEDGGWELQQELVSALMAAFLRADKNEFKRRMQGEAPAEEEEEEAPKATPLKGKSKDQSLSEAGKAS